MTSWRSLSFRMPVLATCFGASVFLAACDGLLPARGKDTANVETLATVPDSQQLDKIVVPETKSWVWTDGDRRGWGFGSVVPEMYAPPEGGFGLRAPLEPEYPDILIRSQPLSIEGSAYDRIIIDIECESPAEKNDLTIYYSTPDHGESADFRALPIDAKDLSAGERRTLVYDMTELAAGGNDWTSSTIEKVRFDLPQGAGSEYIVHSIRICSSASPDCK